MEGILNLVLSLQINLLAARNERESVQIAMRPKISWGGSGVAGIVQVFSGDLCSTSGDRLVSLNNYSYSLVCSSPYKRSEVVVCRLVVGQSLRLRRVVPILGVPDALVPLDLPVSQINLLPG